MSKPTVYVETTVIGHLATRLQPDLVVAARQLASQKWWDSRNDYELFISQIVVDECAAGDPVAAPERLDVIENIAILDINSEASALSQMLMKRHGIPSSEPRDALHIAIAAVSGIEYLVTWNFRHIANAATRSLIERICEESGYIPPTICSPDELLGI